MHYRDGARRDMEIARAAVRTRIYHFQPHQPLKSIHGALDIEVFLLEAGEHAALDGAAPVHDQQIGVTLRCDFIVVNHPEAALHGGFEMVTNGNGVRRLGAGGKNSRAIQVVETAVEAYFDPQPTRLLQQGGVQRLRTRATFHHVKERLAASHLVAFAPSVESIASAAGQHGELRGNADFPQQVERVLLGAPILQPLEVAVETMPDFALRLVNQHAAAGLGQDDGGCEPRGSRAADLDKLSLHHAAHWLLPPLPINYSCPPQHEWLAGAAPLVDFSGSAANALWHASEQK